MFNLSNRPRISHTAYELLKALPFALLFILTVLNLVSASGITFAFMEHRLTYQATYSIGFDLTPLIALLAALCFIILAKSNIFYSILSMTGFLLYPVLGLNFALGVSSILLASLGVYKLRLRNEFLTILLSSFSIVYLSAIIYWLIFYPLGWSYPLYNLAAQEFYLYYLTAPLSILILAAVIIASIYKPITILQRKTVQETNVQINQINRKITFYLTLIMGLGVLAALYPNLPGVNPNSVNIGTDVVHYVPFLDQVNQNITKITEVYSGSRPVFFLILLGFQKMLGLDSFWAVSLFPLLIIPLLALSIFYLVRELTRDCECALWASFFTVAGFHTVVGLYGFLLADMLGLVFAFMMLTMFFKWTDSSDWRFLAGTIFFGATLLYIHPWTFDEYVPFIALAIIPFIIQRKDKKIVVLVVALIILSAIGFGVVEALKSNLFGGVGGLTALEFLGMLINFDISLNSIFSSIFFYSGTLANVALLCIFLVGLLKQNLRGTARLYFTLFPVGTIFAFLIFNIDIKARILFNIPFGVYAAIGMIEYRKIKDVKLKTILVIFVVLMLTSYQLRSLANLI